LHCLTLLVVSFLVFQGLADNGTLAFANDTSTTFEYTYNALEDTGNVYSIQLFTNSDEFSFEEGALTVGVSDISRQQNDSPLVLLWKVYST